MYEGTSITTLLMLMVLPKYVFSVIIIKLIITLNTIFISNQLLIISIGILSLIAGSVITFFQKSTKILYLWFYYTIFNFYNFISFTLYNELYLFLFLFSKL